MTLITKYSDYTVNPIEYVIATIKSELALRDLSGLTNGMIEILKPTKQHPLVALMDSAINPNGRNLEDLRSSLLPALSVTPANPVPDGVALGGSPESGVVDDDFIAILEDLYNKTDEEIQSEVLISKPQIELIIGAYRRRGTNRLLYQRKKWNKKEELNISLWSESADLDILLGNVLDSILAIIQGEIGDLSPIRECEIRTTKGLTNFNFGRTIFGTEYSLTFLNTYSIYSVYTEQYIRPDSFNANLTYTIPGEPDNGTNISTP